MAEVRLRMFAAARDAAGRSDLTVEAATVGDVLEHARATFGPSFAEVLEHSRVWLNGESPVRGESTEVADGDEVAVLPPVSGG